MARVIPYEEKLTPKPAPKRRGRKKQIAEPEEEAAQETFFNTVKIEYGIHFVEI